jgi:hypothetical protein
LGAILLTGCECLGCFEVSHDEPEPSIAPACIETYAPGDTISVELGAPYDSASEYYYDRRIPSYPFYDTPGHGCEGADGLEAGSVLTFTLRGLYAFPEANCSPWDADVAPEPFRKGKPFSEMVDNIEGVSIAVSSIEGQLGSRRARVLRGLFTPTKDPMGELKERELPPLVVARMLTFEDDDTSSSCSDTWVASAKSNP